MRAGFVAFLNFVATIYVQLTLFVHGFKNFGNVGVNYKFNEGHIFRRLFIFFNLNALIKFQYVFLSNFPLETKRTSVYEKVLIFRIPHKFGREYFKMLTCHFREILSKQT